MILTITGPTEGPLGPTGPMSLFHAQRRAWQQMEACKAGDCRYRDPKRSQQECESDHTTGCEGYAAHVHLEDGVPVLRWDYCPRFRTKWWPAEKARRRTERQRRQRRQREERGAGRFTEDG